MHLRRIWDIREYSASKRLVTMGIDGFLRITGRSHRLSYGSAGGGRGELAATVPGRYANITYLPRYSKERLILASPGRYFPWALFFVVNAAHNKEYSCRPWLSQDDQGALPRSGWVSASYLTVPGRRERSWYLFSLTDAATTRGLVPPV